MTRYVPAVSAPTLWRGVLTGWSTARGDRDAGLVLQAVGHPGGAGSGTLAHPRVRQGLGGVRAALRLRSRARAARLSGELLRSLPHGVASRPGWQLVDLRRRGPTRHGMPQVLRRRL